MNNPIKYMTLLINLELIVHFFSSDSFKNHKLNFEFNLSNAVNLHKKSKSKKKNINLQMI